MFGRGYFFRSPGHNGVNNFCYVRVLCVLCVVCVQNARHGQDRTVEAQTFQRNAEERGVSDEGYT